MTSRSKTVSKMKVLAIVLLVVAAASAKHEQYQGWKSFFLKPTTREQQLTIGRIVDDLQIDVLSHPLVQREGLVLVRPDQLDAFVKSMDDIDVNYWIHSNDVKEALDTDDELIEANNNETMARGGARIPYNNYQPLHVYDAYLDDIARRFPNLVTLVEPARSFEGHPIKYLRISTTNFQQTSKPVIFIDGGIHSREWVSPPTVTWVIRKLLEDVTEPDLLQRFDWIVLPIVNPDGYKFSFESSRFWRKTRSTDQSISSLLCPGVDGNRNYDFFFGTVGTSSLACTDNFGGSRAFSEIETRVVRDIILQHLPRMALYLTMHSFGSMILYPWGHDGSLSNNALALHTVGIGMANAIHANKIPYFPNYVVGNSLNVIGYGASGASEDYAHSVGVPLSFTYELPGLSSGFQGFNLNPRYIEQVCRETWAGIVVGARMAGDMWVPGP